MNIKMKMAKLGITQVEMIFELRHRGLNVQPPMLSSILNGIYTYPKAKIILKECEKVVLEREKAYVR